MTAAAFTSYRGAVDGTVAEAGALDAYAEQAALLHDATLRTAINGELICYGQTDRSGPRRLLGTWTTGALRSHVYDPGAGR